MRWHPIQLAGGPYRLGENALEVIGKPTLVQAQAAGHMLGHMERRNQKWLADWYRDIRERFPQKYSQLLDTETFDEDTLKNYLWVCESIPARNWMLDRGVSFSVHQSVVGLDHEHQRKVLQKAAERHLTLHEVREEVQKIKRRPVQAGQADTMHTVEVIVRLSLEASTPYAAEQAAWGKVKTAVSALGHAHVIAAHAIGLRVVRAKKAG